MALRSSASSPIVSHAPRLPRSGRRGPRSGPRSRRPRQPPARGASRSTGVALVARRFELEPLEREQLPDHLVEPLRFELHPVERLARLRAASPPRQPQGDAQTRERRAQLVRDVAEQPALGRHEGLEPLGHVIEVVAEIGELVAPPADASADPGRQVAARELPCRAPQRDHRRGKVAREAVAHQARGQEQRRGRVARTCSCAGRAPRVGGTRRRARSAPLPGPSPRRASSNRITVSKARPSLDAARAASSRAFGGASRPETSVAALAEEVSAGLSSCARRARCNALEGRRPLALVGLGSVCAQIATVARTGCATRETPGSVASSRSTARTPDRRASIASQNQRKILRNRLRITAYSSDLPRPAARRGSRRRGPT